MRNNSNKNTKCKKHVQKCLNPFNDGILKQKWYVKIKEISQYWQTSYNSVLKENVPIKIQIKNIQIPLLDCTINQSDQLRQSCSLLLFPKYNAMPLNIPSTSTSTKRTRTMYDIKTKIFHHKDQTFAPDEAAYPSPHQRHHNQQP